MNIGQAGRRLSDLGAVIIEKLSHTAVLLYKDCGARLIFESGNKIDTIAPAKGFEGAIKFFTEGTAGMPSPLSLFGPIGTLKIHRVPAELKTDMEVLVWFEELPEVHIEIQNQVEC